MLKFHPYVIYRVLSVAKTIMLQAGGHQLMKLKDGYLIKPTKLSEVEFYSIHLKQYIELSKFIPTFHGSGLTCDIKDMFTETEYQTILEKGYTHYVMLENLTTVPMSIIDMKLGSVHWRSDASEELIRNHKTRNSLSITEKYKFRIDGSIINQSTYHKDDCRNMPIEKVIEIISTVPKQHIPTINTWITELINLLSKTNLNIYGPSMLLIYNSTHLTIKLVDFTTYELLTERHDDIIESLMSIKDIINS